MTKTLCTELKLCCFHYLQLYSNSFIHNPNNFQTFLSTHRDWATPIKMIPINVSNNRAIFRFVVSMFILMSNISTKAEKKIQCCYSITTFLILCSAVFPSRKHFIIESTNLSPHLLGRQLLNTKT